MFFLAFILVALLGLTSVPSYATSNLGVTATAYYHDRTCDHLVPLVLKTRELGDSRSAFDVLFNHLVEVPSSELEMACIESRLGVSLKRLSLQSGTVLVLSIKNRIWEAELIKSLYLQRNANVLLWFGIPPLLQSDQQRQAWPLFGTKRRIRLPWIDLGITFNLGVEAGDKVSAKLLGIYNGRSAVMNEEFQIGREDLTVSLPSWKLFQGEHAANNEAAKGEVLRLFDRPGGDYIDFARDQSQKMALHISIGDLIRSAEEFGISSVEDFQVTLKTESQGSERFIRSMQAAGLRFDISSPDLWVRHSPPCGQVM